MNILTFTSLYPNSLHPLFGIFVRHRMEAYLQRYRPDWTVVAPVPYFPALPFPTVARYDRMARIPRVERIGAAEVYHPRYLTTPKVGRRWYGHCMAFGAMNVVAQLHRERPIDLMDVHFVYPDGYAACRIARRLKIPYVLSARGSDLTRFSRWPAIQPLLRDTFAECAHVICVSEQLAEISRSLGAPPAKTTVIPNGVDLTRFRPVSTAEARRALGLPGDAYIILSVGHLIERKAFRFLLDGFARCTIPKKYLILVGEGEQHDELRELCNRLGIAHQVLFAGGVPNEAMPAWYGSADLFALISRNEGTPNVLCEAMAMGLPTVGANIPGIRELIHSSDLGILTTERTGAAVCTALQQAAERSWDREQIQQAGRKRTWDTVSDELHPIFSSVAGFRAGGSVHPVSSENVRHHPASKAVP